MKRFSKPLFVLLITTMTLSGCIFIHTDRHQNRDSGVDLTEDIERVEVGYTCVWYNDIDDNGSCQLSGADQVGATCSCLAPQGTRHGTVR